jgi:hypothetical protein
MIKLFKGREPINQILIIGKDTSSKSFTVAPSFAVVLLREKRCPGCRGNRVYLTKGIAFISRIIVVVNHETLPQVH